MMFALSFGFQRRYAIAITHMGEMGVIRQSKRPITSFSWLMARRSQNSNHSHRGLQCRCISSILFENGKSEASVQENGRSIAIQFPSGDTSVFHAPWLWSNDPTYIHPTSGQRVRSVASFTGQSIRSVTIVPAAHDTIHDKYVTIPIPPPPPGCLHPIGTVFRTIHHNVDQEKSNKHNNNGSSSSHDDIDDEKPQQVQWLLKVCWEPLRDDSSSSRSNNSSIESLESFYDLDWLHQCRYDLVALQQRRAKTKIDSNRRLGRIKDNDHDDNPIQITQVAFDQLFATDDGLPNESVLFELLSSIVEYGAALVTHATTTPPSSSSEKDQEESVARVGRALAGGSLSHGALYGNVFHVQSIPVAHNIAYTSAPLQPHQDLAYYESMPGLQLLHCLSNQVRTGGESTLMDAMAAAQEFRHLAPTYFETLILCPATFIKQREGADMVYRRPHIIMDDSNEVVVAVNWSPPFEGPLSVAPDLVEDYYRAYAAFSYMLDNSLDPNDNVYPGLEPELVKKLCSYAKEFTWERRLEPGEIIVFNNRRMLHGRRGFELMPLDDSSSSSSAEGVGRHLVGCYTNIDETLNQYRLLLRHRPDRGARVVRTFGNGSLGTM